MIRFIPADYYNGVKRDARDHLNWILIKILCQEFQLRLSYWDVAQMESSQLGVHSTKLSIILVILF
jgi:hypothetical protein